MTNRFEDSGDEELVASAQRGERAAFDALVERHKKKAYQIAFSFTRDRDEAKDLSQEAFLRAFLHLNGFNGRATFYTWFYRILVNLCVDYQRKRRLVWEPLDDRTEPASTDGDPFSPDRRLMRSEIARRINQGLEGLSPRQRTAFLLKNRDGLSVVEIAALMGLSAQTVRVHLHHAVMALREALAEPVQEESQCPTSKK